MSQAPPFGVVGEGLQAGEVAGAVDERLTGRPRQLIDASVEDRDALPEVLVRELTRAQDLPGLEVDLAQARSLLQARAFEEASPPEGQALRERVLVVREGPHQRVTGGRALRAGRLRACRSGTHRDDEDTDR
jgi:hypothetical protein